jgi:hypothetical protein
MKIRNILIAALATAAIAIFALGAAFTLTHGPSAFILGLTGFYTLSLVAGYLNPTI